MEKFFTIAGLIGAFCVLSMYFALERGWISSKSQVFYIVNGIGALLVTASIAIDFEPSDLGGITTEGIWCLISLIGIYSYWKKKKANQND